MPGADRPSQTRASEREMRERERQDPPFAERGRRPPLCSFIFATPGYVNALGTVRLGWNDVGVVIHILDDGLGIWTVRVHM